jgi:dipeptidyl aminopeptidase/acylaminoacyl peptidase
LKLFQAGMKQWGLKMQDDIADSVKWAVEKGIADPKRVCIMGGSYGGYATLMGLVNDPGLYRCGIAYAAVTDIPAMFESGMTVLSDIHDDYMKYGVPELIGDLNKDAAQFVATSPLKQAARITAPLLMAHGSSDRRVPAPHFRRLRSALPENKRRGARLVHGRNPDRFLEAGRKIPRPPYRRGRQNGVSWGLVHH